MHKIYLPFGDRYMETRPLTKGISMYKTYYFVDAALTLHIVHSSKTGKFNFRNYPKMKN